jgi:DNA-binding MarR family transcriptional regulator
MNELERHRRIMEKFGRIINKFIYIEKNPRDFGTGSPLYPSEIHLIQTIGKTPRINVTELAKRQGISKAAISQKLKRLEYKDLVGRYKEYGNEKEVRLRLTPKGKIAFHGHEQFHSKMDAGVIEKMDDMSADELNVLERVLDEMNEYADLFIK